MKQAMMVLLGSLLVSVVAQDPAGDPPAPEAGGGWWGDLLAEEVIPLESLLQKPDPWRGRTVGLVVQFQRKGKIENPYHTRFDLDRYDSFQVWGGDAPLWVKDVFDRPFANLFARRGSEAARALESATDYSRWAIRGEVAEVVRGEPWIEIKSARRLTTQLDEPSLVNIVKGFMLRDLKRWDAAASAFHAADAPSLPRSVRALVAREESMALDRGGKTTLGLTRLETAERVVGTDAAMSDLIRAFRAKLQNDGR